MEGIEPRRLHALALVRGTASLCLDAVRGGSVGSAFARETVAAVDVRAVRAKLERRRARMIVPGDSEYVAQLEELVDPPAAIFVRGGPLDEAVAGPSVAIVGARRCSPYGREVAEEVAAGVAAAGVTVVSGAALGVDAAAHRGALRAGGTTVAVLGSGIDVPHPRTNRALIEQIASCGTVVSEYPPGRPAHPRQFPARNRIIAALARVVVVVEGAADSGSLITAELALDVSREVAAVPGQITSELSVGPHDLIRDGATLIRSADDVLSMLGMLRSGEAAGERGDAADGGRSGEATGVARPALPPEEASLFRHVAGAATVDAIASAAGVSPQRALTLLASLELRGLVRSRGGRYERSVSARAVGRTGKQGTARTLAK